MSMIARILLGIIFLVLGLNGFLHFLPTPPIGGMAGTFFNALIDSHFYVMVFAVQVIAAIMLLTDQYVPLALVLLAAVLANVLNFHITMMPSGLALPLFATLLWFVTAWPLRAHFAQLFVRKVNAV